VAGDRARDIEEAVKDTRILSMVVLDSMDVLRDLLKTPPSKATLSAALIDLGRAAVVRLLALGHPNPGMHSQGGIPRVD
jgi:hypothetical protein